MPTVSTVLDAYLLLHSPHKTAREQRADRRRAQMWRAYLGSGMAVSEIGIEEWEAFAEDRRAGRIDSCGVEASTTTAQVRPRTVQADQTWLMGALEWATRCRQAGAFLLDRNPLRGLPLVRDPSPRQPAFTEAEVEALRSVAESVTTEIRVEGVRRTVRSYLPELIDFAAETGRRITAILSLTEEDILFGAPRPDDLQEEDDWYGEIRWAAGNDKMGMESLAPMTERVQRAAQRAIRRPRRGSVYLFPSPTDPAEPLGYRLAFKWLQRAEKLAGVRPIGWHGFRRRLATVLMGENPKMVARYVGWKSLASVFRYQQPGRGAIAHMANQAVASRGRPGRG